MFSFEDGVANIIENIISKYESHFEREFPLFEYLGITRNNKYDFSVSGVKNLELFVDKRIHKNEPVKMPDDYEVRKY